ncbi:hypothetical protein ES703_78433 [subsurface metagenome]
MFGLISWQLFLYALRLQSMNQITAILGIEFYPFVFIAVLGSLLLTLVFFIQFLYILGGVRRQ